MYNYGPYRGLLGGGPLGSSALADDNAVSSLQEGLIATPITAASPVVSTTNLGQTFALVGQAILTSAPSQTSTSLTQTPNFTVSAVSTGQPTLSFPSLSQNGVFAGTTILTTSLLSSPVVTQSYSVTANSILTGLPVLTQSSFVSLKSFVATNLYSENSVLSSPSLNDKVNRFRLNNQVYDKIYVGNAVLKKAYRNGSVLYNQ